MRRLLLVAVLLFPGLPLFADTFTFGGPRSTNNDDSCDIAALPAATLLLPYFEVDLENFEGETTLFTVTNVGNRAQIVRVTLWTDYGYPVVSFNVYLTGYDVQSINLRDVLLAGLVGGPEGTGTAVSPRGELSRSAGPGRDVFNCTRIPHLTPAMIETMQDAFLLGRVPGSGGSCVVGTTHENATGYATIDVVGQCSDAMPADDAYFNRDLRYDNVLMGEYQQLNPASRYAQGGAMVHIRAIPEGGTQDTRARDMAFRENFPRTFYERVWSNPNLSDARQPLPTTFAGRWINGGPTAFETGFKIWRELPSRGERQCGVAVAELTFTEIVLFDEQENAFASRPVGPIGTPLPPMIPAAAFIGVTDYDVVPVITNGALAGWAYLNLDTDDEEFRADQAWVISSMRAEGRYSGDMDATALGNGCSRLPEERSEINGGTTIIGPAPNTTP